jgi:hypothetical protein
LRCGSLRLKKRDRKQDAARVPGNPHAWTRGKEWAGQPGRPAGAISLCLFGDCGDFYQAGGWAGGD